MFFCISFKGHGCSHQVDFIIEDQSDQAWLLPLFNALFFNTQDISSYFPKFQYCGSLLHAASFTEFVVA